MSAPDKQKTSASSPLLHGVDFTSAPRSRKGITIASGTLERDTFRLQGLLTLTDFPAFVRWLDDIEAQNEPETNSGYHSERLGR